MAELCLMASHGYPPNLVFNQEHGIATRLLKDPQQFSPHPNGKQEIPGPGLITITPFQNQRLERLDGILEPNQWINPTVKTPVIIEGRDAVPNTEFITFDISKTKPNEILQLSMPLSGDEVISHPFASSLVFPSSSQFYAQELLLDFIGDLARNSKLTFYPDGRVEFTGSGTEMKDLLSVVTEFYLFRNSVKSRRQQSLLVPHFNWLSTEEARTAIDASLLKLEATTLPLKRPSKIKIKNPRKNRSRRAGPTPERDLYKRNYFHACESLLSLMLDKRQQQSRTATLTLKKSGPELLELLNWFSAGIAGTGIAVLFSVIFNVASGRVPFCSSKLLSTGLGFGLVWLSNAVTKLGATMVHIRSRNGNKLGLKDEEMMMERLNMSLKEIYFRAGTLMVMVVLRLA